MVRNNSNYIMRITGNEDIGKKQLENFTDANTDSQVIAATSKLLSTGVDTKTVKLIVLDEEIASMTEFKQFIGRGTRLLPNKGKEYFTIMDFGNNSEKFADPSFNGPAEMILAVDGGNGNKDVLPVDYGVPEPKPAKPISGDILDGDSKKVFINGVDVSIIKETVKYYDVDGKLITESIVEYSKKNN